MKEKRRVFRKMAALLITAAMIAGMIPTAAFAEVANKSEGAAETAGDTDEDTVSVDATEDAAAEEADDDGTPDSGNVASVIMANGQTTEYETITGAVTAWINAGNGATLKLLENVTTTATIVVNSGSSESPMILDLNDHGIMYTGTDRAPVITIRRDSALELIDSAENKTKRYVTLTDYRGTAVGTEPGSGRIEVTGGYITGGTGDPTQENVGAGVYIKEGSFTMNGGTICGNATGDGGGVYCYHGKFKMNGGTICNNRASGGSGAFIKGSTAVFTLSGGRIVNNTSPYTGWAGINLAEECTINLRRGEISARYGAFYKYDDRPILDLSGASSIYVSSNKDDGSDAVLTDATTAAANITSYAYLKVDDRVAVVTTDDTSTNYSEFSEAVQAWNTAGAGATLTLFSDVTTGGTITVNGGTATNPMILDLNDHGILFTGDGSVIFIPEEKSLRLTDSSETHTTRYILTTIDKRGTSVCSAEPADDHITVEGGYISGGGFSSGWDNDDYNGAGVKNYGTFQMDAGTICGNKTFNNGGGVYNHGTGAFTMKGGEIRGNWADTRGGGLFSDGSFVMKGGVIGDNRTLWPNNGSAIYANDHDKLTFRGSIYAGRTAGETELTTEESLKNNLHSAVIYLKVVPVGCAGVSKDGEEVFYEDFSEAVDAWKTKGAGAILKLWDNIETDATITVSGGNAENPMVLDLNGYGILFTGDGSAIHVPSGKGLKLTDTESRQPKRYIVFSGGKGTKVFDAVPDEGTVYAEVTGGYITGGAVSSSDLKGSGIYNEGSLEINAGTILGNKDSAIYQGSGGALSFGDAPGVYAGSANDGSDQELLYIETVTGGPNDYGYIRATSTAFIARVSDGSTSEEYIDLDEAVEAWNASGDGAVLKLLRDVEAEGTINVTGGSASAPMILDLNDHGIIRKGTGSGSVIKTEAGSFFTLSDTATEKRTRYVIIDNGIGVGVSDTQPGTGVYRQVRGGFVTGGTGEIKEGRAYGGGIYNMGTLLMQEGSIVANKAGAGDGGGVYNIDGSLTLDGGSISGNSADRGGGIYIGSGSACLKKGSIRENDAIYAAGVWTETGSFDMEGGSIKDNIAGMGIEALYIGFGASFFMKGGEITGGPDNHLKTVQPASEGLVRFGNGTLYTGKNTDGTDATVTDPDHITKEVMEGLRYFRLDPDEEYNTASVSIPGGKETAYSSFKAALQAWQTGGDGARLTLLRDIVISDTIMVNAGTEDAPLILDLNDHGILKKGEGSVILVDDEGALKLTDSCRMPSRRYIRLTAEGRGEEVLSSEPGAGTEFITVDGGYITGGTGMPFNDGKRGGGILNHGYIQMDSGTICGNTAYYGGGYASYHSGHCYMTGGSICHNSASDGGGMYLGSIAAVNGRITRTIINGAEISYNHAGNYGGGIYDDKSILVLLDGTISHNSAMYQGGGIRLAYPGEAFLFMLGGEISNNSAGNEGNAISRTDGVEVLFNGEVHAGTETDGSDADHVSEKTAGENAENYGSIRIPFTRTLKYEPVWGPFYTGKPQKPDINVYFGRIPLLKDRDYTIKFSNNVKAGTKAKFTITGKGNYKGRVTGTFTIMWAPFSTSNDDKYGVPAVTMSEIPTVGYNAKKAYRPVPVMTYNNMKLKKGRDFRITYHGSREDAVGKKNPVVPKEPGTYYARVEGINNYADYMVVSFMIAEKDKIPVSRLTVSKIADQPYAGNQIIPDPVVSLGNKVLTKGVDYEIEVPSSNVEIGKGEIVITGLGEYSGRRTVTFNITGIPINKVTVSGIPASVEYDGKKHTPAMNLSYRAGANAESVPVEWRTQEEYDSMSDADKRSVNCIVSYSNNLNAGRATVTLTGVNGGSGTLKKTFKITPYNAAVHKDDIKMDPVSEQSYVKTGAKPKATVKVTNSEGDIIELKEGTDYVLSYSNNRKLSDGTGKKAPVVKATCKGNFKGTNANLKSAFAIVPADIGETIQVVVNDVEYKDKPGNWKSAVSFIDSAGKKLKAGTDYDRAVKYYKVVSGNEIELKNTDKLEIGDTVKVAAKAKGTCYTGEVSGTYNIVKKSLAKLKVSAPAQIFTGEEITLDPKDLVWKSGKKKVTGVEFVIDESTYKNNLRKGKATVVVRGTGDWSGSKTVTFTIAPRVLKWFRSLLKK